MFARLCIVVAGIVASVVMSATDLAAAPILSPTGVLVNSAGDYSAAAAIDSTHDQSGLSAGFISGVTDFDAYLAGNPVHEWIFTDGSEWFSVAGETAGTIVYDLGGQYNVSRLALWNEEFSGILTMDVETSTDAGFAAAVSVGNFAPTNTPFDQSYPAEVFDLTDSVARYVRLTITGPQVPNRGVYLSMGEIAFEAAAVPEPASLLLIGLGAMGVCARRRFQSRIR